jgi:hypothetical protein
MMFGIVLTYTAPIEEIGSALPDHVEWLAEQYDHGHFLGSGRRNPRTGGEIITRPRPDLDAIGGRRPVLCAEPRRVPGTRVRRDQDGPEFSFAS